jgi:DNA-directed RNA polymerase subunit RPC12/RpoP
METVGVRYTGWAALDRDPQDDSVEYVCPRCGRDGFKVARRDRCEYRFTDGFIQDTSGEPATCRHCGTALLVAPVVLVHNQDEKRRFRAVFALEDVSLAN